MKNNEFDTSIKDYLNRKIYKKFDYITINALDDYILVQTVVDTIEYKTHWYSYDFEKIKSEINTQMQVIYFLWLFECEYYNGWYTQFYANSCYSYWKYLPDLCKKIGLDLIWENIKKANDIYLLSQSEIDNKSKESKETFLDLYEDMFFDDLEIQLNGLLEAIDLRIIMTKYIRDNINYFIW